MLPACPRVPGGPGDHGLGQGRSPHASWENVPGRLGGEHGALCRHGNGMQMCQLLFFSFFLFPPLFFFLFARHCNTYYVSTSGACSGGEGGFVPCHALASQRSPRAGRLPAGGVHPAAGPLPWASPRSYGQKQQPPRKKSDHIITNLTFQREARIKSKAEKIERGREREREGKLSRSWGVSWSDS